MTRPAAVVLASIIAFAGSAAVAQAPGPVVPTRPATQMSAGPCNMITVNINTGELQGSIFEGFAVQPTANLGSVAVRNVKASLNVRISTGALVCYTRASTTRVSGVVRAKARAKARAVRVINRDGQARVTCSTKHRRGKTLVTCMADRG
jgi:hypothetical protein